MRWPCKWPTRFRLALWLAVGLAAGPLHVVPGAGPEETYVVVVSPDVEADDVTLGELRRIFQFKQRYWRPGQPITLLYSEPSLDPGSLLLERIYETDYRGLKRLILERLYSDDIDLAPKVVASDDSAVAFVGAGRGLIAVVRIDALDKGPAKVLSIDGSGPDSAGYPLRR